MGNCRLAVRVDRVGEPGPDQTLVFKTNLGDVTIAGAEAPLRVETNPETLEPAPYVRTAWRLVQATILRVRTRHLNGLYDFG